MTNSDELKALYTIYKNQRVLGAQVAKNIRQRRKEVGMTQLELARLMKTKQSAVARWERVSYGRFSLNALNKIAYYLDTTVHALTGDRIENE